MSDSEQTERIAQYDPNQDTLFDSEDLPPVELNENRFIPVTSKSINA